jgi:mediator of RNA polymerase II transcription subunit 5
MMDSVNVNALQFEATVMDAPVINSRAGLYVYINAMVFVAGFSFVALLTV